MLDILKDTSELNFIGLNEKSNLWEPLLTEQLINSSGILESGITTEKTPNIETSISKYFISDPFK